MVPYGYVYKLTNKINGKTYIGSRKLSKDSSWRQYLGSGKLVKQARDKYGEESIVKTLLAYSWNQEDLFSLERRIIVEEKSKGKAEYNLAIYTPNTDNFNNVSPEVRKLWRENLSIGIRKSYDNRPNPNVIEFEFRLNEFRKRYSDNEIVDSYSDMKNYEKVARKYNTSRNIIRKILLENDALITSREQSSATRDKIATTLSGSPRRFCGCGKKLSNRKYSSCFSCKYHISDSEKTTVLTLRSSGSSVREISRKTGMSRTRVNRILS